MTNIANTTKDRHTGAVKRRDFMRWAAASGLVAATTKLRGGEVPRSVPKVCIYTEQFQSLPIPEVCQVFQRIGVDGLDLTVRPGGHIEPDRAKEELPQAAKTARDHGLEIMMLTTGITAPDRRAEEILAACQKLNIPRIKLGYFPAGEFGNLAKGMDDVRRSLDAIVKLAAKYDVRPCVHVHSGATIPSNGFVLYELIRETPPDRIGAYLDSYHMTITGGAGSWRQAIDLLRPWISLVALKNFQWHKLERDDIGQQQWRTNYCRLADGIAPIPDFVGTIHQAGYRGFYTLHTEYRLPVHECIQLTTDDFAYLQKVFARLS
ncbi:MAG: sugar phosphate isomerase/epimerase [Planctomycetota bacterium]|nr:sugar phosphate isomerase/epimerase [Planctomycetota bacterium]